MSQYKQDLKSPGDRGREVVQHHVGGDSVCPGVPGFIRFLKSVCGWVLPPKADLQEGQQNQVSAGGSTHKGLSCPFPHKALT